MRVIWWNRSPPLRDDASGPVISECGFRARDDFLSFIGEENDEMVLARSSLSNRLRAWMDFEAGLNGEQRLGREEWNFGRSLRYKSFQLVRYYGWYSNKMRGRRAKQGGRRSADRGRRRGGDRRFCPRAAPHPF